MKTTVRVLSVILVLFLCLPSNKAYAWWGHEHHHGHPSFGLHVSLLPEGYSSVWIGGTRYYYCDGYYYVPQGPEYVVVDPPTPTVVPNAPSYYQPVVVNGITYYVNNGVYYTYTPYGYQLVTSPPTVQAAPVVVTNPAPAVAPTAATQGSSSTVQEDTFTVNIPNDKGGYVPVVIKRSGKGFIGPQGEFYSEFPKVTQLKLMYGK